MYVWQMHVSCARLYVKCIYFNMHCMLCLNHLHACRICMGMDTTTKQTSNAGYVMRNALTGLYFNGVNFSSTREGAKVMQEEPNKTVIAYVWPGAEIVAV